MWRAPSCDSSNNDHPTALRCRGAGAVHHIKSSHFVYQKPYPGWLGEVFRKDKSAKIVLAKRAGFAGDKT
jgi:hypothetical protein